MHRSISRLAVLWAFGLIAVAGCGEQPVSPLPVRTAGQPGASTPAGTPRVPAGASPTSAKAVPGTPNRPPRPRPTKARTTRPAQPTSSAPPSSCLGAVVYDLDLQSTELAMTDWLCFAVGAVLRLQGTGPGLVTVEPSSIVSRNYAGGVEELRLVRPGTLTVTIPQDEQTYTITVVVITP